MSIVQEMCIVPKNILQNLIESKEVNILQKNIKPELNLKNNENKINLESELKRIIKPKIKLKAIDLYNWIIRNVKELELQSNGDILSPIKNINLLTFIEDVYSNKKTFSKDTLNLYKVWVSYINLPHRYIQNNTIKNYIFPNLMSDKELLTDFASYKKISDNKNKRKLSFSDPINISKKKIKNDDDDDENSIGLNETPPDARNLEKYINKKYNETVVTPAITRSRSKISTNVNLGHGIIFTKSSPVYKWINY